LKQSYPLQQGVDTCVTGDQHLPRDRLAAEIGGIELGRREEKLGLCIDRDPEVFFGPRIAAIVTAQPRLDMRDRHAGHCGTERAAQRARRVSLDEDELRRIERRHDAPRDEADVHVRICNAGAAKVHQRKVGKAVLVGIEMRMLARQDDEWAKPPLRESSCYGSKLDCLRTRSDDERYAMIVQPSP
jgi:hypothetical protein